MPLLRPELALKKITVQSVKDKKGVKEREVVSLCVHKCSVGMDKVD